ncbi:hypothetical protein [Mucilaginibacter ginsenosidivorax]
MPGRIDFLGYDRLTGVHIRLASGDFTLLYGHLSQVFVMPGDSVNSCTPLGITGYAKCINMYSILITT